MDLKLVFVLVFLIAISYETNVNCYSDQLTVKAWRNFHKSQAELYDVVTTPELVDKWIKFIMFFDAADYKPFGIGKHFKAYFENGSLLFRITNYQKGSFIAMESSNVSLRPYIELHILNDCQTIPIENSTITSRCDSRTSASSKLEIRLALRRTSALFQFTVGVIFRQIFMEQFQESLGNLEMVLDKL